MSVVVWDGKTLAADRQITVSGLGKLGSKIKRLDNGTVLAFTGEVEAGLAVMRWFEEGADRDKWPDSQTNKESWTKLIVATSENVVQYEMLPEPQLVYGEYAAFGSGRDFALGALAMGADARRAVAVASQFSTECGFGVEAYDLIQPVDKSTSTLKWRGSPNHSENFRRFFPVAPTPSNGK